MNAVYAAALELQTFFDERDWPFCVIGGLAVIRWGEPRATRHVDLTLITDFDKDVPMIHDLLRTFAPRIPDAFEFALTNRVVLVTASNGVTADIGLGAFPFEKQMVERSSRFAFLPDVLIRTCSAEDLVILTTIAGRGRDWSDIEGVLVVQGSQLDWNFIETTLASMAELFDEGDPLSRLAELRRLAQLP